MEDPDINEKALEDIIPAAIAGDEQALNTLKFCMWLTRVLDRISARAQRSFQVDAAELRDFTLDTLVLKIKTIKNPNNRTWRVCLAGWCKRVCTRRALNILRQRRKFESPFPEDDERLADEISSSSGALSPGKSAELNELRQIARLVVLSFPAVDVMITYMWAEGLKLRVIARLTGIPYQTVNKRQKKIQRAIVRKIVATQEELAAVAVQELLKGEPELVAGFQELVLKSLENIRFRVGSVQVIEPLSC